MEKKKTSKDRVWLFPPTQTRVFQLKKTLNNRLLASDEKKNSKAGVRAAPSPSFGNARRRTFTCRQNAFHCKSHLPAWITIRVPPAP